MLVILSPSKTLDFKAPASGDYTMPECLEDTKLLIHECKKLSKADIQQLMGVSEKLAELNYNRFQSFKTPFNLDNAKQAVFAFKGDVYDGLAVENFNEQDISYAQDHLRILSGLYGLLKPLDLIQPYRLEMGRKLKNQKGKNLYNFWNEKITSLLNNTLKAKGDNLLVNLASNEYYNAVNENDIEGEIITPNFKVNKNGQYKVIGLLAKRARGLMAQYIVKNRITEINQLKDFNEDGYNYNAEMSNGNNMIFTREA